MAASSSTTRPRTNRNSRPQSDFFRPKFPLDPFACSSPKLREPWYLKNDRLPFVASNPRQDVILALGAPTTKDLEPLLLSKHLSNSLLIIASHQPPAIPHSTLPTVRILRLTEPLAIEDAGAVRFVNVLEWAERVARLWRKHGGYGSVELSEHDDGQQHLPPPSLFRFRGSQSTPPSPRSSSSQLSSEPLPRPRSTSSRIIHRSRPALPVVDPTQRPFDGLINFLPKHTAEKSLLKQAILVTTISRPFLIAAAPRAIERSSNRRSLFSSKSTTSVYLPPTPPYHSGDSLNFLPPGPTKSHLVHLLPTDTHSFHSHAHSRLVQSIESFLLSYAYPATLNMSMSIDESMDRARPYLMLASTLCEVLENGNNASDPSGSPYGPWPSECTVAELVLCGSLDGNDLSPSRTGKARLERMTPRAWISGPSDVVLVSDDLTTPGITNVLVTPPPPEFPSPTYHNGTDHHGSPRTRQQYYPHESFVSSSLSTSSTSNSNAPSTPSPLAPFRAKRCSSMPRGGLPTPPDSDESGSEPTSPEPVYDDRRRVVSGIPTFSAPPPQEAQPCHHNSTDSEESHAAGPPQKVKRIRWKFWKRTGRRSASAS